MSQLTAHLKRMDRKFPGLIQHPIDRYCPLRSSPHEQQAEITACMAECFSTLHAMDRKRLLSIANLELPDAVFRRFLRVALQS